MLINLPNKQPVYFAEVKAGYSFVYEGGLYMKLQYLHNNAMSKDNKYVNVVSLLTGGTKYIEEGEEVSEINAHEVVPKPSTSSNEA